MGSPECFKMTPAPDSSHAPSEYISYGRGVLSRGPPHLGDADSAVDRIWTKKKVEARQQ